MSLPFRFKSAVIVKEGRTTQLAIDTIKKWLAVTSLPQLQEEFIVLFLLVCTNDIPTTKKTIEAYFKIKNGAPQIFDGYDLENAQLKKTFKVVGTCLIPKRINNNAIIFLKLNNTYYRDLDVVAAIKLICMMLHLCQICHPPNELIIIADAKGLGFLHLTRLKMSPIISILEYIQQAMPIRLKYIHILNTNYVIHRMLDIFKLFIKSDLLACIHLHSPEMDMEEFHQNWVSASFLPEDYGGDLPPFEKLNLETINEIKKAQEFFKAEERLRSSSI